MFENSKTFLKMKIIWSMGNSPNVSNKYNVNMRNLTRHVCKKKPSMEEMVKSDVFWPFFEGSKIENFVFSIDSVLPNLLNTP